jgi:hypothetical protein
VLHTPRDRFFLETDRTRQTNGIPADLHGVADSEPNANRPPHIHLGSRQYLAFYALGEPVQGRGFWFNARLHTRAASTGRNLPILQSGGLFMPERLWQLLVSLFHVRSLRVVLLACVCWLHMSATYLRGEPGASLARRSKRSLRSLHIATARSVGSAAASLCSPKLLGVQAQARTVPSTP